MELSIFKSGLDDYILIFTDNLRYSEIASLGHSAHCGRHSRFSFRPHSLILVLGLD